MTHERARCLGDRPQLLGYCDFRCTDSGLGAVSVALKLKLEKKLLIASVRTVAQLLLVGYVLEWVFDIDTPWVLIPVVIIMVGAAAREAVKRPDRTFKGVDWMALVTLVIVGVATVTIVTQVIIQIEYWYQPQYVIPLLGMIFGNMLTAVSLTLDYLLEAFDIKRARIEMELSLGATSWEAARDLVGQSVSRGMIPILNSMMVVGLVTLPGMMTGQILSGVDPLIAVKYQIMVMFMLAAATALGSIIMAVLVYRRTFNGHHQLVTDVIEKRNSD
ncbi:MAG: iron export ABC transporter permease subunit FetB [Planctomycetota bacterium]|nr:iron export ABC transporter permease subunit FetB [Planctomycetota bacterium]